MFFYIITAISFTYCVFMCMANYWKLDKAAIQGTYIIVLWIAFLLYFHIYRASDMLSITVSLLNICAGAGFILLWWLYDLKQRKSQREKDNKLKEETYARQCQRHGQLMKEVIKNELQSYG
jgi:hypothetical protein